MRARHLVCAVLFVAACGKKAEDKKAQPEATPKVVEKKPAEPAAPARMTVTAKSPEAKAEFDKGHDLAMNIRFADAVAQYRKAVELDPEFAVATAELGYVTQGNEGTDLLNKASTLAGKATEPEKAWIEALQAARAGDTPKALAAFDKVVQLVPGQWEADLLAANFSNMRADHATAIKHLEHALSVKPDLPNAQNGLAYAYAAQRDWDKAIAAATKQTELLPKEPNPQDTLGEIQLGAGKFDDAEKSFLKATEIDPKFTIAWQGVALARAFRGDYKGAYEAVAKQQESTAPGEKYDATIDKAWIQFAEGKTADALTTLDAIDKDPDAKKVPVYAFAPLDRSLMLALSGKYADAAKASATALSRADALTGGAKDRLMTGYRIAVLHTAAVQGKPAPDTDKLLAAAQEDGKRLGADPLEASMEAYMQGLATWAKSGPKAAVEQLSKCLPDLVGCRYDLALAQRKAGDAAGADAIEKEILETPRRDAAIVYFRTHLPKK